MSSTLQPPSRCTDTDNRDRTMTMTLYDLSCQRDGHIIGPHAPSCNRIRWCPLACPRSTTSPRPIGRASRPASERSQDRAHHCAQSKRAPRLRPLHSRGEAPRSQSGAAAGSLTRRSEDRNSLVSERGGRGKRIPSRAAKEPQERPRPRSGG